MRMYPIEISILNSSRHFLRLGSVLKRMPRRAVYDSLKEGEYGRCDLLFSPGNVKVYRSDSLGISVQLKRYADDKQVHSVSESLEDISDQSIIKQIIPGK